MCWMYLSHEIPEFKSGIVQILVFMSNQLHYKKAIGHVKVRSCLLQMIHYQPTADSTFEF